MIPLRVSLALIAALIALRAVMAAVLPLSADEAYYWLWSKHLAFGYYDHPPMIAWLIRAGTEIFGNTALGVRFSGILLSLPATWLVWQSAALILKDTQRAALAALLFNLTLMVSVEMLAATPDMPSVVFAAAFVWALAKVQQSGDGKWWLAVGVAGGLGLLSKYSALFLGLGALFWLIVDAWQRRGADAPKKTKWLATPWPYLGAALALLIATPHLIWQAQHQWMTFAFQFGRVGGGAVTLRFIGEFLAAQIGLATPLIFLLMVIGLWRASRRGDAKSGNDKLVLAVLCWTAIAYFLQHALHDRIQGNWPCFIFPALAILAADAFRTEGKSRWISYAAAPLAALLLLLTYAHVQFGLLPAVRRAVVQVSPTLATKIQHDPAAQLLGRNFAPVGEVAGAISKARLADAILTTDYQTTAWLRFNQPDVKVIQVTEIQRYPDAPAADAKLLGGRLFYLTELRRDRLRELRKDFGYSGFPTQLQGPGALYVLYPVAKPKSAHIGRMP
jgi:4-amino-4-deoxy-L-arabinose transferase-like glycosyltransferase